MFKFSITFGRGPNRRHWEWPRTNTSRSDTTGSDDLAPSERPLNEHRLGPFTIQIRSDAMAARKDASTQDQCPLFKLPTEIRLYIYLLVLRLPEPVKVRSLSTQHLSLLQTCRRVLQEAETLFYELHRFQYSPLLFRVGHIRLNAITALTIIASSAGSTYSDIKQLHHFPSLTSLYLQREISIRYLNLSEWSIMRKQIQTALRDLPLLREVKIFTPPASSTLTPAEEQRQEKLNQIDTELQRSD